MVIPPGYNGAYSSDDLEEFYYAVVVSDKRAKKCFRHHFPL